MYREEDLRDDVVFEQRASIQAAAYTIYLQLAPNTKNPLTPREFHALFANNWEIFADIENKNNQS